LMRLGINACHGELGGIPVAFLSREILIKSKRATGRTQDAADVEALEM